MQQRLSISTPRCYYAEIDGEGPNFALLLEDLSPARQGDQLAGCSAEVARAAVLELVGLHAPSWCDAFAARHRLARPAGRSRCRGDARVVPAASAGIPGSLRRATGAGRNRDHRSGRRIERRAVRGAAVAVLADPHRLSARQSADRRTKKPAKISVVDWQSITLGSPLGDVAYFLGAGLLPEERRRVERDIVRAYHAKLGAAGIHGLSMDAVLERLPARRFCRILRNRHRVDARAADRARRRDVHDDGAPAQPARDRRRCARVPDLTASDTRV